MSKIGVIAALPVEARCLYPEKLDIASPAEIHSDIFLCLSGIGTESAYTAIEQLLSLEIDALVSWGVAGALDPSLKAGDLLIADSVIISDKNFQTSSDWLVNIKNYFLNISLNPVIAPIASIDAMSITNNDKTLLHNNTGALAVDMESAAIADISSKHNLDFIVIRAIADEIDTPIPEVVTKYTNALGQPDFIPFVISCLKNPRQIKELIKLAKCYNKSIKTLKHCAYDLKKEHFLYNTQRFD